VPTYSTLFFSGSLTTANTTVYTVPAGNVIVLRDVEFRNTGTGTDDLVIGWSGAPGFAGYYLPCHGVASNAAAQWEGRVVLPAQSVVLAHANFGAGEAVISGYLLSS
jgi:hypothetical protein